MTYAGATDHEHSLFMSCGHIDDDDASGVWGLRYDVINMTGQLSGAALTGVGGSAVIPSRMGSSMWRRFLWESQGLG